MNINPKRDMEGARTVISVMAISALNNTLNKNQENGDATKVTSSGELEIVNDQTPVIDTIAGKNIVSLDGYRELADGSKINVDIDKKRRDLQKAIINEQNVEKDLSEGRE